MGPSVRPGLPRAASAPVPVGGAAVTVDTDAGSAPILTIKDLSVWFDDDGRGGSHDGSTQVVRSISLDVRAGERIGLVGESGSGKTTTILAAMGLLPSSASVSGQILFGGTDILAGGERTIQPHRWVDLAMVFQGAMNSLNPVYPIRQQIAEAMKVHGTHRGDDRKRRVTELLELVGIPAGRAHAFPHELSGGMRQRAVIAMALACNPRVLLADEPTTALDVVIQRRILELLTELSRELDLALILVTHDLGVVAESCDRAAVMLDGRIVEQGPVERLRSAPDHDYTRQLFAATPSLRDARPPAEETVRDPLLVVRDLSIEFHGRRTVTDVVLRRPEVTIPAVNRISFEVRRGEFVSLVGQSGCGKTTTANSILGTVPVSSGVVELAGVSITNLSRGALKDMRRRVQMIYQDPYESLDWRFRIRQVLAEPMQIHGVGTARSRQATIVDALERVSLTPASRYLDRYPHELSGGQRQRVSIAACLVLAPELLLADELVSMLDVSLRLGILDLLNRLRSDSSLGILMITHDLSTAGVYSDRIIVMREGRIVEDGAAWDVINRPQHAYSRELLDSVPDVRHVRS